MADPTPDARLALIVTLRRAAQHVYLAADEGPADHLNKILTQAADALAAAPDRALVEVVRRWQAAKRAYAAAGYPQTGMPITGDAVYDLGEAERKLLAFPLPAPVAGEGETCGLPCEQHDDCDRPVWHLRRVRAREPCRINKARRSAGVLRAARRLFRPPRRLLLGVHAPHGDAMTARIRTISVRGWGLAIWWPECGLQPFWPDGYAWFSLRHPLSACLVLGLRGGLRCYRLLP